jgi:hypothetical protein
MNTLNIHQRASVEATKKKTIFNFIHTKKVKRMRSLRNLFLFVLLATDFVEREETKTDELPPSDCFEDKNICQRCWLGTS